MLLYKQRESIQEKRQGKLNERHDFAQAAILDYRFQQIDHPPCNPNMALSDYYLFDYLKKNIRGWYFWENFKLSEAVLAHFKDKLKGYI